LYRDGENAADLVERCRDAVLDEAHERSNGGEPRVACTGAVGALVLDVVEEREDELCVDLLDLEIRRRYAQALVCERKQELEGIRIGGTCVLTGEALTKKRSDVRSYRGHDFPLSKCR
jgi:hypothetical protein